MRVQSDEMIKQWEKWRYGVISANDARLEGFEEEREQDSEYVDKGVEKEKELREKKWEGQ